MRQVAVGQERFAFTPCRYGQSCCHDKTSGLISAIILVVTSSVMLNLFQFFTEASPTQFVDLTSDSGFGSSYQNLVLNQDGTIMSTNAASSIVLNQTSLLSYDRYILNMTNLNNTFLYTYGSEVGFLYYGIVYQIICLCFEFVMIVLAASPLIAKRGECVMMIIEDLNVKLQKSCHSHENLKLFFNLIHHHHDNQSE